MISFTNEKRMIYFLYLLGCFKTLIQEISTTTIWLFYPTYSAYTYFFSAKGSNPSYAYQYLSYPFLFLLLISFDSVLKAQLDAISIILIQANTLFISNFPTHIG